MGRPAILKVDIVADAKGVGAGVSSAESRFSKLGKIGKAAMLGVAAGIGAAVAVGVKFAAMAAEDEKGQKLLANTLKNTTGARRKDIASVEDWITKQGQALGVADDDLRPALGKLAAATHDVGKAQKLASLAMDVSAGTGKSLSTVTEALVKAQNGSLGGLSRLGVATKTATGETKSLQQITAELAKTHAGAAATAANTAAGRYGRLKLQLSEMAEGIGSHLLPVGNKLASWALKMAPKVQALANDLGKKLGPAVKAVGSFITERAIPAGKAIYEWFIEKIAPGIKRALTPVLAGLKGAWANVTKAVQDHRPQLEKIGNVLKTLAEFIAQKVAPVVGKVMGKAFETAGDIIGTTIDVIATLVDWIDSAVQKVEDLVGWIGKIHVPDLGDLNPFAADVTVVAPSLTGQSPSYDSRRGWSSAAWSGGGLAGLLGAIASVPSSTRSSRPVQVVNITVQGAFDPLSTARQIRKILRDYDTLVSTP